MERPKCNCGLEMKLVSYIGYYESFKYWELNEYCKCYADIDDLKEDVEYRGDYA